MADERDRGERVRVRVVSIAAPDSSSTRNRRAAASPGSASVRRVLASKGARGTSSGRSPCGVRSGLRSGGIQRQGGRATARTRAQTSPPHSGAVRPAPVALPRKMDGTKRTTATQRQRIREGDRPSRSRGGGVARTAQSSGWWHRSLSGPCAVDRRLLGGRVMPGGGGTGHAGVPRWLVGWWQRRRPSSPTPWRPEPRARGPQLEQPPRRRLRRPSADCSSWSMAPPVEPAARVPVTAAQRDGGPGRGGGGGVPPALLLPRL